MWYNKYMKNKFLALAFSSILITGCGHSQSSNGVNTYPQQVSNQQNSNQYDPNDPNNQQIQPNSQGYYVDPDSGNYYNPSNGQAYSRTGTLLTGMALGGFLGYLAGHHVANSQFKHSYFQYYRHEYPQYEYKYHSYYHPNYGYHTSVVHVYHHYSHH
jgi:hypothetical protein